METNDVLQKNTENKVLSYCRKHRMFEPGDKVVLGVSGGADSICLLFVLLKLKALLGIELYVVHVNHGVRPDAGEDAAYVEEICNKHGIPFLLKEIHLASLARELGATQEEAGRIARYEAFQKAVERYGCQKIAVAHNSNDRAETMLFHLFRGTGLKGLAGIRPVRDNVVRPFLCLERQEIEAYLHGREIPYKQDSTNEADDYTRNRIRHHILSYAREEISESCITNMSRTADILAQEEAYLEEQTLSAAESCVKRCEDADLESANDTKAEKLSGNKIIVDVAAFNKLHDVIKRRLLLYLLKELSPRHQDIAMVHIEDVASLFEKEGNRQIHLPYGIRAQRSYDQVRLFRKEHPEETNTGTNDCESRTVYLEEIGTQEKEILLADGSKCLLQVMENPWKCSKKQDIPENVCTKWLDYDKIKKPLEIRTRKTGDYFSIFGKDSLQHKKLKDYMITEKIPKQERDAIWLIAEENHILWMVGYRISEFYKVNINTKKVLRVHFVKE